MLSVAFFVWWISMTDLGIKKLLNKYSNKLYAVIIFPVIIYSTSICNICSFLNSKNTISYDPDRLPFRHYLLDIL